VPLLICTRLIYAGAVDASPRQKLQRSAFAASPCCKCGPLESISPLDSINNNEVLMSENKEQPHNFNSIADAEERETRNEMRVTVSGEGVAKGQGDGLEVERGGV